MLALAAIDPLDATATLAQFAPMNRREVRTVAGPPDFETVALPHLDAVARFARSLTRNREDADDLVQETFLRAYRGWHTFEAESNARPWLFAICRNTFVRLRRAKGNLVESDEADIDAIPAVMEHIAAARAGLGEMFEQLELGTAIRSAVDRLPEPHHSVLVLVDLEERSYAEAAEILLVPVGTVRSRLFRARRMVQEALIVYAEDMGLGNTRAPDAPRALDAVPQGVLSPQLRGRADPREPGVNPHV